MVSTEERLTRKVDSPTNDVLRFRFCFRTSFDVFHALPCFGPTVLFLNFTLGDPATLTCSLELFREDVRVMFHSLCACTVREALC